MNKPILLVAMLAMVLLAAAPALTQTDIDASPALTTDATQTSEDTAVDPAAVPATEPAAAPASTPAPAPAGVWVGCELLYTPPGDQCTVDANGEITLPDGTTAPVLVTPDGNVFIQDTNGALTLVGTGASFITPEDPAASEAPATTEPAA